MTESVAAVVVTRNRMAVLGETLRAIARQTRVADAVVVVDSGSNDGTIPLLQREFPDIEVIHFDDNIGPGEGRSVGMQWAIAHGHDLIWLVDDDSSPIPVALERLCRAVHAVPDVAMVGIRGGAVRVGVIRHQRPPSRPPDLHQMPVVRSVDFVLLDGALVRRSAIEAGGYPRADFFIMMEDVEYPLRLTRAGHRVYVLDEDLINYRHLGSQTGDPATIWRGYYQARNHVRMALDLRMPSLLFGAALRELHYLLVNVGRRGGGVRLSLRWRGISDALANRMGRRVDPNEQRFRRPPTGP